MSNSILPCGIVCDLLPLVLDQVASEESTAFVENHLATCETCRRVRDKMKARIEEKVPNIDGERFKKIGKKLDRTLSFPRRLMITVFVFILSILIAFGGINRLTQLAKFNSSNPVVVKEWTLAVNESNQFVLTCTHDSKGYSTGYTIRPAEEGVWYVQLHTNGGMRWDPTKPFTSSIYMEPLVFLDGTLQYRTREHIVRWNPERQTTIEDQTDSYRPVIELRLGTSENYETLWRQGDPLPRSSPFVTP